MDIINRVKNMLVSPKTEWSVIDEENAPHMKVCTTYVVLLALIPAVAAFIGYGLFGRGAFVGLGFRYAVIQYITMVGGIYLAAFVINILAENFGSKKDFDKAFSLVAYAYTPTLVSGIFYIFLPLGFLTFLASIYSLYLLYIGLTPMMKTSDEKRTTYFIVSLLVMAGAFVLLSSILTAILVGSFLLR